MAFDPAIAGMGPDAFELRRNALPNRWGGPVGYRFIVSSDLGPDAVFTMTIHPDVSGRPAVLTMHERIIEHINQHDGVKWVSFDEIAEDFRRRSTANGDS